MSDHPQLAALAKKFPPALVHSRTVGGGREADYVPASVVVEKLLATVGPIGWQVDVKLGDPVVCIGSLTCEIDGRQVTVQGVGEDTDAKSAESDALKRAARMVGCGLHLWSQDDYRLDRALRTDEVSDD